MNYLWISYSKMSYSKWKFLIQLLEYIVFMKFHLSLSRWNPAQNPGVRADTRSLPTSDLVTDSSDSEDEYALRFSNQGHHQRTK